MENLGGEGFRGADIYMGPTQYMNHNVDAIVIILLYQLLWFVMVLRD